MFCQNCGNQTTEGSTFCPKCGNSFVANAPPPPGAPQPGTPLVPGAPKPLSSLPLTKQRLAIIIASAVGIISVFLPWRVANIWGVGVSQSGINMGADGIIALLLFAAPIVFALLGDKKARLTQLYEILSGVAGGLGALWGIIVIVVINTEIFGLSRAGFGVFLLIIAGLAVAAAAFLMPRFIKE